MLRTLYPATVGLAVFVAYPAVVDQQDFAKLAGGDAVRGALRFLAHQPEEPGASRAVMAGAGAFTRPVIASAEAPAPRAAKISLAQPAAPRPQTLNRALLGDRVVQNAPARPPAHFSAGSVLERQSLLAPAPLSDQTVQMAFVEPLPNDKAIEVASLFHLKPEPKPVVDPELPVMVASLVLESADKVLSYAPEENALRSPFAAVLNETSTPLIPKLDEKDHAWAARPLSSDAFSEAEQHCLTAGIYFEARGEPVRGQAAVAQVILNRVKNPKYPNSICGVVYQNKDWRNRCQFSFACDKVADKVRDPKRWQLAQYVAKETTEGRIWLAEVGSSTHYHATYVKPKWAKAMDKVGKIGLHIFYRTFGGGWS